MLENLDLNKEVLSFLIDAPSDKDRAKKYLSYGDTMKVYNFENFMCMPSPETKTNEVCKIQINDYHYKLVERNIKAYRTMLVDRVSKEGDALMGYKILSSQDDLYKILNELHLYQHGSYDDIKVKHYAVHYFKELCEKSREIMSLKLIQEFD